MRVKQPPATLVLPDARAMGPPELQLFGNPFEDFVLERPAIKPHNAEMLTGFLPETARTRLRMRRNAGESIRLD
jgi:hypothetical protein